MREPLKSPQPKEYYKFGVISSGFGVDFYIKTPDSTLRTQNLAGV
jgi:hypothetical protein